jgi:hypothetical protein
MALPVVPLVAFLGVDWVVEHLVEVVAVSATCGVLAVAAVVALMRWADRRDARRAAMWQFRHVREVPSARPAEVPSAVRPELAASGLHLRFYGLPDAEQAAIIRQALPGTGPGQ